MAKVPRPPRLNFLGPMEVSVGGRPVPLPSSQKTRALLAYLAVTGRPHQRERLCGMFWDVTDDPRGSLRWSLSKLRVLDDARSRRICTDRSAVSFDPSDAFVDTVEVRSATSGGLEGLDVARLRELAALFRGPFLEGFSLPDFDEFEAWRVAEREAFKEIHLRILRELVSRLGDRPAEAVPYAREVVRLAPAVEADRARLVELLGATGHREEAEEHYALGRRRIKETGVMRGDLDHAWKRAVAPASSASVSAPQQTVRFCTARDGVRIAYATLGDGACLVKAGNWMTHLEHDWKNPLWRRLSRELALEYRLIRYDQRGNGLSDWDVADFSLDACVADLEAVVDASAPERFALLGISQGCRPAIAYAAKHPERVTKLVLYGGSARGWKHRPPGARATRSGLQALLREGWGRDQPAFRQVFTTLFMPAASTEQIAWFNELQRVSTSAENAYRITEASGDADVTHLLAGVRAPTLVMHATGDAMVPFDEARGLAAGIPGARFVSLESQNHLLLEDEPAFGRFLDETRAFLG